MIFFSLLLHNHQPIGNFNYIIERAYEKAYYPLLKAFYEHPKIKFSVHFSGFLLETLLKKKKFYNLVGGMVERGQAELLSGGYYEPPLAVFSERDGIEQIRKLTSLIKREFSYEPEGAWLPERIWEPQLPGLLKKAGLKYTLVDDTHFLWAGKSKENTYGYFTTEDRGDVIDIIPGDKKLRYFIPFREINQTEEYLRNLPENSFIAMGDDGEKFGIWPGTYDWCYKNGWLERFLSWLETQQWIETIQTKEHKKAPYLGPVYLPTASYEELTEWVLDAETYRKYKETKEKLGENQFLKGGFWRGFFSKYPESNHMNKRVIFLSLKGGKRENVLMAQCNDAYWHGIFGGLYLPHLRAEIWRNIIEAEKEFKGEYNFDFDSDGKDESIIYTDKFTAVLDDDGTLSEISLRKPPFCISDVLTRRKEGYHNELTKAVAHVEGTKSIHEALRLKEPDALDYLVFDPYRRVNFNLVVLPEWTEFFAWEKGKVFPIWVSKGSKIRRKGRKFSYNSDEIKIENKFRFGDSIIFNSKTEINKKALIGVELVLRTSSPELSSLFVNSDELRNPGEFNSSENLKMIDSKLGFKIAIKIEGAKKLWYSPLYTVSSSENGIEKVNQGNLFYIFTPAEKAEIRIKMK